MDRYPALWEAMQAVAADEGMAYEHWRAEWVNKPHAENHLERLLRFISQSKFTTFAAPSSFAATASGRKISGQNKAEPQLHKLIRTTFEVYDFDGDGGPHVASLTLCSLILSHCVSLLCMSCCLSLLCVPGLISLREVEACLGSDMKKDQMENCKQMLSEMDTDTSGSVDYEEWRVFWADCISDNHSAASEATLMTLRHWGQKAHARLAIMPEIDHELKSTTKAQEMQAIGEFSPETHDLVRNSFDLLDFNSDGTISLPEAARMWGVEVGFEKLEDLFDALDVDHSGVVNTMF